jgi:hypothetical protein
VRQPVVRARYEFRDLDSPGLGEWIDGFIERRKPGKQLGRREGSAA